MNKYQKNSNRKRESYSNLLRYDSGTTYPKVKEKYGGVISIGASVRYTNSNICSGNLGCVLQPNGRMTLPGVM